MADIQFVNTYMGGKKQPSISAIRFLAMCSIIACHFCQYYGSEWAWWLNVGVQVFFIISGFLYGNKTIEEPIGWIVKQFKKILVPYYIFLFFAIIGYVLVAPDSISIKNIFGAVLTVGSIRGISHLWFVSYILFCYLITPYLGALRNYLQGKSLWTSLVILFSVFGILAIVNVYTSEHFRSGMVDCYIIGYYTMMLKERWGDKVIPSCFFISVIPCLLTNAIYCYMHYTKGLAMDGFFVHITDYSHLFLGYAITMFLMFAFKNISGNVVFRFSDKFSYEIYLVHQLFILSPFTLLTSSGCQVINIVVTVITILISGVILRFVNNYIQSR